MESNIMKTQARFWQKHPFLKDLLGLFIFIVGVIFVTFALTAFVFRSYNVVGGSMEETLHPDDRVIVNRLPVSVAHLFNKDYIPKRGQIIVFVNPNYRVGDKDQYIIKRAIAFPGERVVVKNGFLTVHNDDHPDGFHPDEEFHYTWWSYRAGVREKNIGWRIDYFIVSASFIDNVVSSTIYKDILGSDHCPVGIEIK